MNSYPRLHANFWSVQKEKKPSARPPAFFRYAKDHRPEAAALRQQGRCDRRQNSRALCGRSLSLAATLRPGSSLQGAKPAFRRREP
jgi:hypothetical protein